jgi:transcription elongation factor GreA
MTKKYQLTKEGYESLLRELEHLKSTRHSAAKNRLSRARAMGDLRENSEYHAAKEDLGEIVGRIAELEEMLRWAEVVDQGVNQLAEDLVSLGTRIKVEKDGTVVDEFDIVGDFEADPLRKKLSHSSPIGKALLGKKKGDTVEVEIPAGKISYRILDIIKKK